MLRNQLAAVALKVEGFGADLDFEAFAVGVLERTLRLVPSMENFCWGCMIAGFAIRGKL